MAKKTGSKLSLKRETLRTLSNDDLRAVGGGTDYKGYGGSLPSVGPSRTDPPQQQINYNYNYNYNNYAP